MRDNGLPLWAARKLNPTTAFFTPINFASTSVFHRLDITPCASVRAMTGTLHAYMAIRP